MCGCGFERWPVGCRHGQQSHRADRTGRRPSRRSPIRLAPASLAIDPAGVLYIAESSRVAKWTSAAGYAVVADGLNAPAGLAINGDGAVLVSETGSNRIRVLGVGGVAHDYRGHGNRRVCGRWRRRYFGPDLNAPMGLAVDAAGTVYFADSGNNRIRTLTPQPAAGSGFIPCSRP